MSMKRPGGRTPHARVSFSPSKIPYVGFSPVRLQTRRQARPSSGDLYAPQAGALKSCSPSGQYGGPDGTGSLVQRPLARQRVLLSRRVIAYYGLIRASRGFLSTYGFDDRSLPFGQSREVPQFTPRVCSPVPSLVPRRTERLRVAITSPLAWAFAVSALARHPQTPRTPVPARLCNEARSSSLSLRPGGIASPAPVRTFTFELPPPESPR